MKSPVISRPARATLTALCSGAAALLLSLQAVASMDVCRSVQDPQFREQVLEQINRVRERGVSCGRLGYFAPAPALSWGESLTHIAQTQAGVMARVGELTHKGPQGENLAERARIAGYPFLRVAENLANGSLHTRELIDGWVGSDEHCVNLMDPRVREVGVACQADGRRWPWWVMTLGAAKRAARPSERMNVVLARADHGT